MVGEIFLADSRGFVTQILQKLFWGVLFLREKKLKRLVWNKIPKG